MDFFSGSASGQRIDVRTDSSEPGYQRGDRAGTTGGGTSLDPERRPVLNGWSRMGWQEFGYSFRHNFPSYRMRHAIRVRRYRRRHPWQFDPDAAPPPERDEDDIVALPPSDEVDHASWRRDAP